MATGAGWGVAAGSSPPGGTHQAGVLLAVPALVESGIFRFADEIYGGLVPSTASSGGKTHHGRMSRACS